MSKYINDGTGRDTFINNAGATWFNPLPTCMFSKFATCRNNRYFGQPDENSIDPFASQRPRGAALWNKSRFGVSLPPHDWHSSHELVAMKDVSYATAVPGTQQPSLAPQRGSQDGEASSDSLSIRRLSDTARKLAASHDGETTNCVTAFTCKTSASSCTAGTERNTDSVTHTVQSSRGDCDAFDPVATAVAVQRVDVPCPERRLYHPGHAATLVSAKNNSTYTPTKNAWGVMAVDSGRLPNIIPTMESTCHYSMRTGMFYNPLDAPPFEPTVSHNTLLEKHSRYY